MNEDEDVTTGRVLAGVVVPTYNHVGTLVGVLEGVAALGLPCVVVDDGSGDGTWDVLKEWRAGREGSGVRLARHERNRGKGAALRSGFAAGLADGWTHAATMDSDGQLEPGDIPRLLEVARERPRALVLGSRPEMMEKCPARCRLGRTLASAAARWETGLTLSDTQCGLRVYPIHAMAGMRWRSDRYSFEAEAIARAAWAGLEVVEVPVRCEYFEGGRRVSHFRPAVDSARQGLLHVSLLLASLAER